MAATIGQKHKNGFKIVEIWDNHSESLKNNLYNDFKGPEHLLGGMNLENEIDTCQTTVECRFYFLIMPHFFINPFPSANPASGLLKSKPVVF